MGKSPGKWIKTLLFGKKSSKSHASRGRSSAANSKDWRGDGEGTDLVVNSPVISEPIPANTDQIGTNLELENVGHPSLNSGGDGILPEDPEDQETTVSKVSNDPERAREEQAAIKAQAAFRGYLARRAFRALKGIIRLQALIRGHLIRRQAVATLHCMWGIVKIQALVRGRKVIHEKGFEDAKHMDPFGRNLSSLKGKASVNAFVRKLLSFPTVAKPLKIHHHLEESNSLWSWLERWTTSRFWRPPPQKKKAVDSKPQRRHYTMETESGRPKRSVRRNFGTNTEPVSNGIMTSEPDKPRRNSRKVSSHPADPVLENPQSELEKVKRNLRKISSSMGESSDRVEVEAEKVKPKISSSVEESSYRVEVETEKAKFNLPKLSNSASDALVQSADGSIEDMNKDTVNLVSDSTQSMEINLNLSVLDARTSSTDILGEDNADSAENMKKDVNLTPDSPQNVEMVSMLMATNGPVDSEDHTAVDLHPLENSEKEGSIPVGNRKLNLEEQVSDENHKASKRKASLSTKSEYTENSIQNNPVLPSYMATTESRKAKVRGQNSPRLSSDGVDKNAFTRRHSLPSSTDGRLTLSPQTQRLVPTSCKGGIRSERSLLSSRDGAGSCKSEFSKRSMGFSGGKGKKILAHVFSVSNLLPTNLLHEDFFLSPHIDDMQLSVSLVMNGTSHLLS